MKAIYLIMLLITFSTFVMSQETNTISKNNKHNSIYFEILGNGYVPSINYERITANLKVNVGIRAGFGFSPENKYSKVYTFPFEVVMVLFGNSKHHLELGVGATYYLEVKNSKFYQDNKNHNKKSVFLFPRVGYRYTGNKGLLLRVGYTPVIEQPALDIFDSPFSFWGGISIGYLF